MKLADTQARFHALVTARDDVAAIAARDAAARAAVEAMVAGDDAAVGGRAAGRLREMYFVRIHDVLRDEYARTAAALGGEAFHALVTDYLQACPPAIRRCARRGRGCRSFSPATRSRRIARGWRSWRGWSARASRCSTGRTRRR